MSGGSSAFFPAAGERDKNTLGWGGGRDLELTRSTDSVVLDFFIAHYYAKKEKQCYW